MRIDLRKARALCTKAEFELVAASGGKGFKALGEARLKSKIGRARALRDKYRDLHRRQRLAARQPGAKPARADANARTAGKAELFEQVLARYVERHAQLRTASGPAKSGRAAQAKRPAGSAAAGKAATGQSKAKRAGVKPAAAGKASASTAGPAGKKPARSPKAPAPTLAAKLPPPPSRGFISEKAAQSARNVRLKSMNARNVQAHVGARGRRNQAKRDSRPK